MWVGCMSSTFAYSTDFDNIQHPLVSEWQSLWFLVALDSRYYYSQGRVRVLVV